MRTDFTIAIPFVRVSNSNNPNMRLSGHGAANSYFEAMAVCFASIRRLHPTVDLELITNALPPDVFALELEKLDVRTRILAFAHEPPFGFTSVFAGSLFLLDALSNVEAATTIFLDPDVLLVKPLHAMLDFLGESVGALAIDYSLTAEINGLSRSGSIELHAALGESPEISPYFGGEIYVIPRAHATAIQKRVERAWDFALARFAEGSSHFVTEEHLLNFALRGVPVKGLDGFARRIWTAHSFRNVKRSDFELTLWHLPAEKDHGFRQLYPMICDRASWFWNASPEEFVLQAAKAMGIRKRSIVRAVLDLVGAAVHYLRSSIARGRMR